MIRFAFITITFVVMTAALAATLWILQLLRLPGRRMVSRAYSRALCALLRIRIGVVGSLSRKDSVLVIANHCSWLDILVLTAVAPVVFVAKREIASWPLIGLVAKLRPTVFVDRSRRQQTADVTAAIAQRLAHGDPVVLFAEGTSSDGNRVLQFRSALFGAAESLFLKERAPVLLQPVSIAYTRIQGLPIGRQHRPLVAWYGDMSFVAHMKEIVCRGALDVVITFGEHFSYAGGDRKALVRSLETRVRALTIETLRGTPARAARAIPFSGEIR
jgi:1-acyl-sn-glycerol-3-phosphate acyltransferase